MKIKFHSNPITNPAKLNLQLSLTPEEVEETLGLFTFYVEPLQLYKQNHLHSRTKIPESILPLFIEMEPDGFMLNPMIDPLDAMSQLHQIKTYYENVDNVDYRYFVAPSKEVFDLVTAPLRNHAFAQIEKPVLEATLTSDNPFTGDVRVRLHSDNPNISYFLHLETPSELYEGHVPREKDFQFYSTYSQAEGVIRIELFQDMVKSHFFNKYTYQNTCIIYHH